MRARRLAGEAGQSDSVAVYLVGTGAVVLLVAFVLWLIMFMAGWHSTPVDKVGLHYTGGPIQGEKFKGVVQPGSGTKFYGLLDKQVLLPVTQRDYIVSLNPNEGDRHTADAITAPAKGGVEMAFEIAAYFTLNTSDKVIPRFYERVCRKYHCTNDRGWDQLLNNAFRKPIERTMQGLVRQYDVGELYANENTGGLSGDKDALRLIEQQVASGLKDRINRLLGGDYFCGPGFDRTHPEDCPEIQFIINSATPTGKNVKSAFERNRTSEIDLQTARNETKVKEEEARAVAAQRAELGSALSAEFNAYLEAQADIECAKRQGCTFIRSSVPITVGAPK